MFNNEFKKNYSDMVKSLFDKVEPLIKEGWTEEDMYQFFLFIEKNQDKVQGKKFEEIKNIYLEEKNIKEKRKY